MIPLDEIQQFIDSTQAENAELRQRQRELRERNDCQGLEERKELTLRFADIKEISNKEMANTKKAFQTGVWVIIQHKKEWLEKVKSNNIQHPKDIEVDKAIIEAEFRDYKIQKKLIEQIAEIKTSPYFRQVGPVAMALEIYLKKGYYINALHAYVNLGQVTLENAPEMLVNALKKAHKGADAEIKKIAEMESQETQDLWWQMFLSTMPKEEEETKPIIMMKLDLMIEKWERHLMNEIEVVRMRRQLRITKAVIQLIK